MIKKMFIAVIAAVMVLSMTIAPALAASFTSSDGILSIELPNDSWTEIQDPETWLAFSDGANLITIDHFSNGEKLPEIPVADAYYVNALSASYSTHNEVFVATGFVKNSEVMNDVNESLLSIKILKYDTKTAIQKDDASGDFSIAPRDMTMYVNVGADTLNVRNGFSVNSARLGELANGTAVHVTGSVQYKGADYGWYQIDFNNGSGFVAADYLTTAAPAAPSPAEPASIVPGGDSPVETYLVYSQGSGHPINITGSEGIFYDGYGNVYYAVGGGNFADAYGAYFSTTVPASAPDTSVIGLVSDGSGRPVSIMQDEDGAYRDDEGNEYYQQGDGSFVDDWDATYQVSYNNEY